MAYGFRTTREFIAMPGPGPETAFREPPGTETGDQDTTGKPVPFGPR